MSFVNFHLACGLVFLFCASVTMAVSLSLTPEAGAVAMTGLSIVVFAAISTEAWKKRHDR